MKASFSPFDLAKRHKGPLILSPIVEVVAHESWSACVVSPLYFDGNFVYLLMSVLFRFLQIMEFSFILLLAPSV